MWLRLREIELSIGVGVKLFGGSGGDVRFSAICSVAGLSIGVVCESGWRVVVVLGGWCRFGALGSFQAWWSVLLFVVPGGGESKRLSQSIDMWPVALQRLHLMVGHLRREWPSWLHSGQTGC